MLATNVSKRMCLGCGRLFIVTRKDKKHCSRACYQKMLRRKRRIEYKNLRENYEKLEKEYKELCEEYDRLLKIVASGKYKDKY